MGLFGLLSLRGLRGLAYALFGGLLLSTLWVTSLTTLSAPSTATTLLTEAGTQVLNPFLVRQGLGLSTSTYNALEVSARAAPTQPLALSVLKAHIAGRDIQGLSYTSTVQLVYSRVAADYYAGGASAAFNIPPQLTQSVPDFALFSLDNIPILPGGPTAAQLPRVLQPFFVFTGLTPASFTATGHQRLLALLPYFWLVTLALGIFAVLLNLSDARLVGLAPTVIHATWPVVAILLAASLLVTVDSASFGSYASLLESIRGAFLPVYGLALLAGIVAWVPLRMALRRTRRARVQAPARAELLARMQNAGLNPRDLLSAYETELPNTPFFRPPPETPPDFGWQQPRTRE